VDGRPQYGGGLPQFVPRGDKARRVDLPLTEKQLWPLKRLPSKFPLRAWKNAVKAAGLAPVVARHVEREVRNVINEEGIQPPVEPKPAIQRFHRLADDDVNQILSMLTLIRNSVANGAVTRIPDLLDEIRPTSQSSTGRMALRHSASVAQRSRGPCLRHLLYFGFRLRANACRIFAARF
jgi:hypothetical protein